MSTTVSDIPSLYEVSQLSRDYPVVGERDTHLVVFLATIAGGLVIMTGPARTGKDQVVDGVEFCRPTNDIANISTSTSKTALYYNNDELNNARIHRYPDIASLDDHIERILKAHGEDNSISHEFTDPTTGDTVTKTLHPPDSMVLFLASDNEQVDLNDYPEVRDRALVVSTDATATQTENINDRQAEMRSGLYERRVTKQRAEEIREYVADIPNRLYIDDSTGGEIVNPVADPINKENPLPQLFPEARMDFPRLLNFIETVTMYHYDGRMEVSIEDRDSTVSMLVTPKDAWLAMRIFGEKMILSVLNLREHDFEMLDLLRSRQDKAWSVADIQDKMRDEGFNLSDRDVRDSLDGMMNKGYVYKDQSGTRVQYTTSPFATPDVVSRDVSLDWESVVETTEKVAYSVLPADIADEYVSNYCQGDGLIAIHPMTGKEVNITDSNSIVDEIRDRQEVESEVIDDDGSDPDEQLTLK